jgi:hypothetical protein
MFNSAMNRKHLLAIVVAVVCAGVLMLAGGLLYVQTHSPHPDMFEYSKVVAAAERYKADLEKRRLPVPSSVTLQELLQRRFLAHDEVKDFDGLQVTVSLRADVTRPTAELMRVRFPNGDECIALGDGSVQQVRR